MRLGPELGRVILEAGGKQSARTLRLGHRVGVFEFYRRHPRPDRLLIPSGPFGEALLRFSSRHPRQ